MNDDIDTLRRKAGTIARNKTQPEPPRSGFMLRAIISLCLIAAGIMCRLGQTPQSSEVFHTISAGISQTQTLEDARSFVTRQIRNFLK